MRVRARKKMIENKTRCPHPNVSPVQLMNPVFRKHALHVWIHYPVVQVVPKNDFSKARAEDFDVLLVAIDTCVI